MPYEIWMICDVCGKRIAVEASTPDELLNFGMELALRTKGYIEMGSDPHVALRLNCPPCQSTRGIDGHGEVSDPKRPPQ